MQALAMDRTQLVRVTDLIHQMPVEYECPIPRVGVSVAPSAQSGKLTNSLPQHHVVVRGDQDCPIIVGDGRREASYGSDDQRETIAHRDMGGGTG